MSRRAAHSKSQWRSCLLILFYVVMFSFRWKKLPVISVFDILHAVSFNHSGLRRLLAWLGAEQTSAQHWTFCTDWIMAFLKSFKLGNSLDICLVTMQWRMFVIFTSCKCVAAVNYTICLDWLLSRHQMQRNISAQAKPELKFLHHYRVFWATDHKLASKNDFYQNLKSSQVCCQRSNL